MLRPQLEELASATGTLSKRQCQLIGGMLKELGRLDRRKTALQAAVSALNPDRDLSVWQVALALESRLRLFGAVSKRRIESGYRLPSAIEVHLLTISDGPQCARKLWAEIRELL